MEAGFRRDALVTVVPRKRPARVPGLARSTVRAVARRTLLDGPERARFEAAWSDRLDGARVAGVGSGRLALLLVLDALEVHPPARIILPAYNASCVPNVLQAAGYRLHFCDIRRDTLGLDVDALPDPPPRDAGAIIVTHIEGNPADVGAVRAWAAAHGLPVVEDAAHALGATFGGAPVGTLADAAIFSLGRGKLLNTVGGGLAIIPRPHAEGRRAAARLSRAVRGLHPASRRVLLLELFKEAIIETGTVPALFGALAMPLLRSARSLGMEPMTALFEDRKSRMPGIPEGMRRGLSNLQARFGLEALASFDEALMRRRRHASRYHAALQGALDLQAPQSGADPAWLEVTALMGRGEDRASFQAALLSRGVDTQRTWMDACDALDAFRSASGSPCPVARDVAERAFYLPTYAALSDAQVEAVITAILGLVATGAKEHGAG
ncbi:MAG: DegT/DnrJ/EryC1/StrS family aminotransferase [Myxococcota bacterium]